jgi:hypothetical protein
MKDETRAALTDRDTWLRLPVMLLFFLLLQVATPLLIVVSLVAWLMRLFTGQQPQGVIDFGRSLGEWFDRCSDYLCGGAQRRPFPFEDHDCPSDRAADDEPPPRAAASSPAAARSADPPGRQGEVPPAVDEAPVPAGATPADKAPAKKKASGKAAPRKKATKKVGKKKASTPAGSSKTSGKKTASKKSSGKKSADEKTPAEDPARSESDD